MRLKLILAGGAAAIGAALVGLQLLLPTPDGDPADLTGIVPAARVRVPKLAAAGQEALPPADSWVDAILARPLFTRDRRPVGAHVASQQDTSAPLPRLAGIAISPQRRSAIFAAPEGGKPTVVAEGDGIAGLTVASITEQGVKLQGPDGEQTVVLAFDSNPRKPDDLTPQPVALPPQQQAPGVPGIVQGGGPGQAPPVLQPGAAFPAGRGFRPGQGLNALSDYQRAISAAAAAQAAQQQQQAQRPPNNGD